MLSLLNFILPAFFVLAIFMLFFSLLILNKRVKNVENKLVEQQISLAEIDYALQKMTTEVTSLSTERHLPVSPKKTHEEKLSSPYASHSF